MEEDDVPGLELNLKMFQLFPGHVHPVQLGPSLGHPTAADQDVVKPPHLVGPSQHLKVENLHRIAEIWSEIRVKKEEDFALIYVIKTSPKGTKCLLLSQDKSNT